MPVMTQVWLHVRALGAPRRRALLLLVSLAAHLLMMAIPMHGAPMAHGATASAGIASPGIASSAPDHARMAGMAHVEASHQQHGGHCGIEWTASRPQPSATALLSLAAPVSVVDVLPLTAGRVLPDEVGPPARGDSQAVLQVFRL
ncbi:MAG: hypothetical protein IT306_01605 [Chloroflexi bacterium]|nr:hypothetical protein [Chloroflexota bacterium]